MKRYGPRASLYVTVAIGIAALVLYATRWPRAELLGLGLVLLAGTLSGWSRYTVDEHGLTRRTPFATTFRRWDEIGGVRGHEVESPRRGAATTLAQVVVDRDGRPLFRLSPWLAGRRDLVRAIRERT